MGGKLIIQGLNLSKKFKRLRMYIYVVSLWKRKPLPPSHSLSKFSLNVAHYKFFRRLISLAIAIVQSSHFLFPTRMTRTILPHIHPLDGTELRAAKSK